MATTDPTPLRAQNDAFRCAQHPIGAQLALGQLVVTSGVAGRGNDFVNRAIHAVREYNDFTADSDPYGEHDFGIFEIDSEKLFWKIDLYDVDLEYGSPNPLDPSVTRRVLTVMLADEY
jgi:Protein of unknown function (DUF3768)